MAKQAQTAGAPAGVEVWTVSQLTRRVKGLLEAQIGKVWVSGEISNWRVSPAGHSYFTLKDENSQLSAVMFKGRLSRLRFEPEGGLEVLLHGEVTVYEQRGNYQIICDDMQPKGVGALQLAYEKLKQKLEAEGLFDESRKKPLPMLPRRIGIVTSPTGAAIRDILNVLERRFAGVHVLLYPARVQGDEAAPEIVEGIRCFDAYGVDVVIVGRGGGSLEDLWPFNEEAVVRAIAEANTPIISAVGHEIDFTLSDFAADVRAPTPSAAAEIVVKERQALVDRVEAQRNRMARSVALQAERLRSRMNRATTSVVFRRPEDLLREPRQRLDEARFAIEERTRSQVTDAQRRLERATRSLALLSPSRQLEQAHERLRARRRQLAALGPVLLGRHRVKLSRLSAQLDALSPLAILSRGYSLTRKLPKGALVRKASQLKPNDRIHVRLGEGAVRAVVEELNPEET